MSGARGVRLVFDCLLAMIVLIEHDLSIVIWLTMADDLLTRRYVQPNFG